MPRLMSVAMTTDAVIERRKTVTRRKGWTFLKVGDRLTLCRKVQGRKPGEPLDRLAEVEVVRVWREPLHWITDEEVAKEGFPGMDRVLFMCEFFVDAQGIALTDEVTRIEWRYVDVSTEDAAAIAEDVHFERTQDAASRYQDTEVDA
jgi:hypothetical protein